MNDSRERYYTRISNEFNGSNVSLKAYWSILKVFLNNKKTPIIEPLLYEYRFGADFTKKAELFISFFATQCTVVYNGGSLPSELLLTFLSNVTFSSDNILKIIQNLDSEKAHGHDRTSIRILKYVNHKYVNLLKLFSNHA